MVEAKGFQKTMHQDLLLQVDQMLTVNFRLEISHTAEAVTVTADPPLVDTTTGTLRQVIDESRMVELPLNGRNAATLTTLVAGAVSAPANGASQSSTFANSVTVSVNGARQTAVNYQLDGGDNVDQYTNVNQPFPMPDSLQEFSVQTSNFSAQYGQNAGAIVNVVSKSGTNSFHGGLFEFVRNSRFNARNWAAPARDQIKRNQFGGTFAGPVLIPRVYNGRNRTFFFFGHQSTRFRDVSTSSQAVVPLASNLTGDLSNVLSAQNPANPLGRAITIRDPQNNQPFPGNIIPASRFDPAALNIVKLLPPAQTANGTVRWTQPFAPQDFDEELMRVDHNFSERDRATFRYFIDTFDNPSIYVSGNILTYRNGQPNRSQNILLQETHIFSPAILNDFRFSVARVNGKQRPPSNTPNLRDLGVDIYQPDDVMKAIEPFSVTGLFSFGANAPGDFTRNNFVWADDVKWVVGRHSFSFGGLWQYGQLDVNNNYRKLGAIGFSGDATGYALADFLLGSIRSFTQSTGEFQNARNTFLNLYVQDDIRVNRRLTVNLGLRWEPFWPWDEIGGRLEIFSPDAFRAGKVSQVYVNAPPGLTFPGDPGFPRGGVGADYHNWAPRLGFAYDLTGRGRTVVRGGAGAFYDSRVISQLTQNTVDVNPFSPSLSLTSPQGTLSKPYVGLAQTPPFPFPAPKNFVFPLPITALTYDPTTAFKVPVNYNWNLTVEQQLPDGWLARAAYVGARSLHMRRDEQLNPVLYVPGAPAPYGNPSLAANSRRLYMPGLTSIGMITQTGAGNYHSLQLTAERRFLRGLTVLANYTWAKSLDDLPLGQTLQANGGGNFAKPIYETGFDRFEYGPSNFDHTHRFVVSWVWELPKLRQAPGALRLIAGGWQTSAILSVQSGDSLTATAGADRSATNGNDRAVVNGNAYGSGACNASVPTCANWLNPTAFSLPLAATATPAQEYAAYPSKYGNVGKGAIRGPGQVGWDAGLFKNFELTERFRLQFRMEAFNVLNRVNLGNPATSVNGAGFGSIRSAGAPRIGQLSLKLNF
jgi:hypothetical protein